MRPLPLRLLIPAALLLFFGAGVGARLHGFSLAAWHLVIDGSAAPEVLLGQPQVVRFDRFERLSGFEKLGTFGRVSLYRVEPPRASQAERQRPRG